MGNLFETFALIMMAHDFSAVGMIVTSSYGTQKQVCVCHKYRTEQFSMVLGRRLPRKVHNPEDSLLRKVQPRWWQAASFCRWMLGQEDIHCKLHDPLPPSCFLPFHSLYLLCDCVFQFDTTNGEIVQEYDRHLGAVNTVTFVDENRRFVTTSDDKSIRVWEW